MLVLPHHFESKQTSVHGHELTADEMEEEGLNKSWSICGHGEGVMHQPSDECYYCGNKLTIPAVMWYGHHERIWMHPDCTEKLSQSLMRDVLELRKGKDYADHFYKKQKAKRKRPT